MLVEQSESRKTDDQRTAGTEDLCGVPRLGKQRRIFVFGMVVRYRVGLSRAHVVQVDREMVVYR